MMTDTPCVKCRRFVDLRDVGWFYGDETFDCRRCCDGTLERELSDTFWRAYNFEAGIVAMGAAKGMTLDWIRENARKAMLMREYWLLASGDGV